MTQFVKCRFRPADTRLYTYINEGDPVAPGDFVKVADARDPNDGWKRVEVMEVTSEEPPFACKPILGLITGEDVDAAITRKFYANLPKSTTNFPEGIADQ